MSEILTPHRIQQLKTRISITDDPESRLFALAQLAQFYSFTNIGAAQKVLDEAFDLLETYPILEISFQCRLNQALVENQLYNFELSEIQFKKAVELAEQSNNPASKIEVYIDYAGTLINMNKRDLSNEYLAKARTLLTNHPNSLLKARWSCREAYWWLHHNNYNRATEFFLDAEKLFNAVGEVNWGIKDQYFQTLIYAGLGNLYGLTGESMKSVRSYLKVVNLCEALEMRSRLTWHYSNVGRAYMQLSDYVNAEIYFRKVVGLPEDLSQSARANASANLGYCLFLEGNYDEAMDLYNHAERIWEAKEQLDTSNLARVNQWKAQIFDALGKRKMAMDYFSKALDLANLAEDYDQQATICSEVARFYAERGDYKNAFEYQILYDHSRQLYLDQVSESKVEIVKLRYEAEQKRQESENLRLEATNLQLKALRAQMNPHFMFNALNAIQELINSEQNLEAAAFLSRFAKLMRQSLDYSELEVISLEDEVEFLKNYLELNAKLRFGGKMDYRIELDEEMEEDIIGIPTMLIQPHLENAIEHGLRSRKSGGLVTLRFELDETEDVVICSVEDNGVGREKTREIQRALGTRRHKSKGLTITQKRLDILSSRHQNTFSIDTIDLKNEQGEPIGTRVEMRIPIVDFQLGINSGE